MTMSVGTCFFVPVFWRTLRSHTDTHTHTIRFVRCLRLMTHSPLTPWPSFVYPQTHCLACRSHFFLHEQQIRTLVGPPLSQGRRGSSIGGGDEREERKEKEEEEEEVK